MPKAPLHPCNKPGCPALVRDTPYCEAHGGYARGQNTGWNDPERGSRQERGLGGNWPRIRALKLAIDPLCEYCLEIGLTVAADQVDHRTPRSRGGTSEWENLASACAGCNRAKGNLTVEEFIAMTPRRRDDRTAWRGPAGLGPSTVELTIVCGPSGAGKTTYVTENRMPGDIVIDLDEIIANLTGRPWYRTSESCHRRGIAIRNEMLKDLAASDNEPGRAWYITSAPTSKERDFWRSRLLPDNLLVIATPLDECKRRLRHDRRRQAQARRFCKLAERWWRQFDNLAGDRLVEDY